MAEYSPPKPANLSPEDSREFNKLIRRRNTAMESVGDIVNFVDRFDKENQPIQELEVRETILPTLQKQFNEAQAALLDIVDAIEVDDRSRRLRQDFASAIMRTLAKIKTFTTTDTVSKPVRVKLPEIKIPMFNGGYSSWQSFKRLFLALACDLEPVVKMQLLLGHLQDQPYRMVEQIKLSAAGYKEAMDILEKKYGNPRLQLNAHFKAIYALPSMGRESAVELRTLVDDLIIQLRGLEALQQPITQWSSWLVYHISSRLDPETFKHWESTLSSNEIPAWEKMQAFLEQRACTLEAIEESSPPATHIAMDRERISKFIPAKNSNHFPKMHHKTSTFLAADNQCKLCKSNQHSFNYCKQFRDLTPSQRLSTVQQLRACLNCFRCNHDVRSCPAAGTCLVCNARHHTQLHDCFGAPSESNLDPTHKSFEPQSHTMCTTGKISKQVLLCTAKLVIQDARGQLIPVRALMDSASQSNFISEALAQQLGLNRLSTSHSVGGLNGSSSNIRQKITAKVASKCTKYQTFSEFLIVPKITSNLPATDINISDWNLPNNIQLADPVFYKSGKIDMLLGAAIFFEVLQEGRINLAAGSPTLVNTQFGWIIGGPVADNKSTSNPHTLCHLSSNEALNNQLQRFFELEHLSEKPLLTQEELACEEWFEKTTERLPSGRYMVRLPLQKDALAKLGSSRPIALKCLERLERKFIRLPQVKAPYVEFMHTYFQLGHMSLLTQPNDDLPHFYCPHHCIEKLESSTTKHRVVFNASAPSSTGISLNDIMMVGPVIQRELFDIALGFRKHPIVLTADLEKMYRQILIHPEDLPLQRIVWRPNLSEQVDAFQLNTITYGHASASYLATRVLLRLAKDEMDNFPLASSAITDFYMDDILTGADTIEQLKKIQKQLIGMFASAGMNLRKFCSNAVPILLNVPPADREQTLDTTNQLVPNQVIKALGLRWNPAEDVLQFIIDGTCPPKNLTKRIILSSIGKLFDPLGLVSPVVILAKVFMQRLWLIQTGWDEPLPHEDQIFWHQFSEKLPALESISIPRLVKLPSASSCQLVGFSDSSERAFGAVIYLRSTDQSGQVQMHLLCSKSRVAPLKTVTIPRLELCAALLLAELMQKSIQALNMEMQSIHLATDSTITLAWISTEPYLLNIFVANRVAKIQDLSRTWNWHHIRTELNPADLISRGIPATELQKSAMWWHGPAFLTTLNPEWLLESPLTVLDDIPELKTFASINEATKSSYIQEFGTLERLTRITAYILRFKHNTTHPEHTIGFLTATELKDSLTHLVSIVQQEEFADEILQLKKQKEVHVKSSLKSLAPFLDSLDGVLRVGGRLHHSPIPYEHKHPAVLPGNHHLTTLIFRDFHHKSHHAGPQALLSYVRTQFWPLHGKSKARQVVHQCYRCFRLLPRAFYQLMGQLPANRVSSTRPFVSSCLDYAGPLLTKRRAQRNSPLEKSYVMVIVCCWSKAVHLEVVSDLSAEACLAALKRFCARRGCVAELYSDNGTNFVGSNNELKRFQQLLANSELVQRYCALQTIDWKFAPPRSPHFNGLCEAGVKSFKSHLKRATAGTVLTFEELNTLTAQIKACLNSRPLTALSDDPSDLKPLTPGHFLIGRALNAVSEPALLDIPINRLNRWQAVQKVYQSFWDRWSREYLHTLQQRHKWQRAEPNTQIDDLVLVKDELTPPTVWALGRVVAIHPGKDDKVRVATVRTQQGEISRAITKLCRLPQKEPDLLEHPDHLDHQLTD